MNKTFLPPDYEVPTSESGYMKFKQGENRFRVLDSAVMGTETWIDEDGARKPLRFKIDQNIPAESIGDSLKHFWAFPVWNYDAKKIQILQITQKGIQKSIRALTKDTDWGNPKGYDLVVTREGEGLDTEYQVNPKPHSELDPGIIQFYKDSNINLEALFTGDDPFAVSDDSGEGYQFLNE